MIAAEILFRNGAWSPGSKKGGGLSVGGNNRSHPQIIVWVVLNCVETLEFDVLSLGINNVQVDFIFWFWLFIGVGGWQLDPTVLRSRVQSSQEGVSLSLPSWFLQEQLLASLRSTREAETAFEMCALLPPEALRYDRQVTHQGTKQNCDNVIDAISSISVL